MKGEPQPLPCTPGSAISRIFCAGAYNRDMRTMRPTHDEECAVACTAEIIGGKWTAILVHDLSEGPRRFSDLERALPGISPRTLSERLRALEEEGVLERRSYAESPPRVEYELTAKGAALLPIIEAMRRFGHEWLVAEHDHSAVQPVGA
jgi:DNA-binding HxlR family transcriptional regulator